MLWLGCARGASSYGICDNFPTVGRLQQALFTFIAALELSGCLLFTDPINKAPVVTITGPSAPVRGTQTDYFALVSDDQGSPSSLNWAEFASQDQSCLWITAAAWASQSSQSLARDRPYAFMAQTLDVVCLCVQATDPYGATGQACQRIAPINSKPTANITDESVLPQGQPTHPLCSTVHLSAKNSTYPANDQVQFNWSMQFAGTNPTGNTIQLARCPGIASDVDQCFGASVSGLYTVTLTIADSTTADGTVTTTTSDPFTLPITVDVDRPACIQATTPDVNAQTVLVSRIEPRTFSVSSVADDCDPYPATSTNLQFVWSLFDPTQPTPQWLPQTNFNAASLVVSQDLFPDVRPGDTVQVRVEVRDTPTQVFYQEGQPGGPICSQDTITCYDSGSSNDCVRWTTWNVQFQP